MADRKAKELLKELRERYKRCIDAEHDNRRRAVDDLKFANVPGNQWQQSVKEARGQERPMYEFNRARITNKRIINEMRSNRPSGKVIGTEDSDKDTADTLEGLCRNIWVSSDGDSITDYAAEYQVGGGMGAWRVCTDYSSDTAFEQDIYVEAIRNPFCLYADPASQDILKRDAQYWILTDRLTKQTFESRYPKAKQVDFEAAEVQYDSDPEWTNENYVRIAEYWWKEPITKTILLLSDGKSVDASTVTPQGLQQLGLQVLKQRLVRTSQIKMAICSGDAILEGPTDWAGCEFPFVIVYGDYTIIDGKVYWNGLTRHMVDAQRAHNWALTSVFESIALAPTAKYWATTAQALGNVSQWAEAHAKNLPVMLYNPDPQAPGPPLRVGGADIPAALMQAAAMSGEEIKASSGIFDASLGAQTQEKSGVAIRARQMQGELATFNYPDNMAKGIRRTWEILIDLIPKIYDTERAVRVLGADGGEKFVRVNQTDPETGQIINDLSRGKFDVTVTVGPSYATQRQEAVEAYTQLAQSNPALWQIGADLILKSMDLPYSDEFAERSRLMLPPQLQQQDGQNVPPEVQQMMAQAQQAMEQVQQHGMLVQKAAEEAQAEQQNAEKAKTDVSLAAADLKVQQAQLEARYAELQAEIAKDIGALQAKLAAQVASIEGQDSQNVANERQLLAEQVQAALQQIQTDAAAYLQQAAALVLQSRSAPQKFVMKRVNGELQGQMMPVEGMQ